MSLQLHIGCGTQLYKGWVNIDPRDIATDEDIEVQRGDALHLEYEDGTVERIFSNALFEHLFLAQHSAVLREWKRTLTQSGFIAAIGIPDFEAVARLYLTGARGITGPTFDCFEAYRYALGFPDGHLWEEGYTWQGWSTEDLPNEAPDGYLPQMHKALFDSNYLSALLASCDLKGTVFRYAYVNEPHVLNLGFVAGHNYKTIDDLMSLPFIDQYVHPNTLTPVSTRGPSRMAQIQQQLEQGR